MSDTDWLKEELRLHMASRIRVALTASGHTRSSCAAHLGVNISSVSYWTTGKNAPTKENLAEIAKLTGASIDWLTDPRPVPLAGRGDPMLLDAVDSAIKQFDWMAENARMKGGPRGEERAKKYDHHAQALLTALGWHDEAPA